MRLLRLLAVAALLAAAGVPLEGQVSPPDSARLVVATQAMMNAITSGDSGVWAPHSRAAWWGVL
jgi:hypothetical protein